MTCNSNLKTSSMDRFMVFLSADLYTTLSKPIVLAGEVDACLVGVGDESLSHVVLSGLLVKETQKPPSMGS